MAVRCSEIQDPRTTKKFMIDGLRTNLEAAAIVMQLIALNPAALKGFAHKYNGIAAYQTGANQEYQIHP